MKPILRSICILSFLFPGAIFSQELFVYTEPASNMPAKSVGIRVSNWLMNDKTEPSVNYQFIPEIMWGVNRNLMLHAEGFFNNRNAQGAGVYAKYRFFTEDAKNRHFRMAAYGRAAVNNGVIDQEAIETNGNNSGYELGLITTGLLYKQALSASVSYERALDNRNDNKIPAAQEVHAINYSLSAGRLILPKKYTSYGQTNFNIMLEMLGQNLTGSGKMFIDIAPAMQFIFNSQLRVDIGYRKQLYGNMIRTAPNGFMIRAEYLLFNVISSKKK